MKNYYHIIIPFITLSVMLLSSCQEEDPCPRTSLLVKLMVKNGGRIALVPIHCLGVGRLLHIIIFMMEKA